jgi:AcrR family transcriptional regulator
MHAAERKGPMSIAHTSAPPPWRTTRGRPEPFDLGADEDARAVIVAAARATLATHGYHAATYARIADLARVAPDDVRRLFPERRDLILQALGLPALLGPVDELLYLPGEEIVARYLAFWETGGNTSILRSLFRAAVADERVGSALEGYLTKAIVKPLAERMQETDACPRIRLVISYLVGLTLSRYVLQEEPLASADSETVAAWAGPSVDAFLRGGLASRQPERAFMTSLS